MDFSFDARVALAAANTAVRERFGIEHPELLLRSHLPRSRGGLKCFVTQYFSPQGSLVTVDTLVTSSEAEGSAKTHVFGEVIRAGVFDKFEKDLSLNPELV